MIRKGCLYREWQRNSGKGHSLGELRNGGDRRPRFRYVCEISYRGRRYRFRSTNFCNAVRALNEMSVRYSD